MATHTSEVLGTPELNKQAIIRNLSTIANTEIETSIEGLEQLIAENEVFRNFDAAVKMFGQDYIWRGEMIRGMQKAGTKFFSLMVSTPPLLEGKSFLYTEMIDNGENNYGLLMPFHGDGRLDRTRVTSAGSFLDEKVFSLQPYCAMRLQDEIDACSTISWVTQMAAADLVNYIEREWPSTLEEKLARLSYPSL